MRSELEETDWVAERPAPGCGTARPVATSGPFRRPKRRLSRSSLLFNAGKNITHMFETDEIYTMWKTLLQISDPKAMDAQLRKIGNYKFENFETIPLFDVCIEVIVDPKIVE